jgi:hypothetical protein
MRSLVLTIITICATGSCSRSDGEIKAFERHLTTLGKKELALAAQVSIKHQEFKDLQNQANQLSMRLAALKSKEREALALIPESWYANHSNLQRTLKRIPKSLRKTLKRIHEEFGPNTAVQRFARAIEAGEGIAIANALSGWEQRAGFAELNQDDDEVPLEDPYDIICPQIDSLHCSPFYEPLNPVLLCRAFSAEGQGEAFVIGLREGIPVILEAHRDPTGTTLLEAKELDRWIQEYKASNSTR